MIEKLNKSEMNELKGGVSVEEYCNTFLSLAKGDYARDNWSDDQWKSWSNAYSKHC